MSNSQIEPNDSAGPSVLANPERLHDGSSLAEKTSSSVPGEKTISCVSCRRRKLKCDRVKPVCGTCTRLQHECEYPERKRKIGTKRRNMKELEARLAQVETQLVAESKADTVSPIIQGSLPKANWNDIGMDINVEIGDEILTGQSFDVPQGNFDFDAIDSSFPYGDMFSQELLALGLQEPLPAQSVIDELYEIYFQQYHRTMPMIHKFRYYTSLDRAPHMRPPVCLQYAIWTMAASISEKYSSYEDLLYERARRYAEAAEMKGHGETFVSVYHAQTWALISFYEAKKALFSRAWMSTGRMTRLVHMLGLHRLDGEGSDVRRILPPARDWIELEERRRMFWAAFYGDRWSSAGTGWPMMIDEKQIMTNLPASEESFERGVPQDTTTLEEALTPDGARKITPFAGVILSATLFGHNFQHLQRIGPDERPDDLANGEFWKRHRKMDNVLSNTFMFFPDNLRLPAGLRDMNVVFLHMNVHASAICLHQAAILTAERHNLPQDFIRQCHTRSIMNAEEIANIMRLITHVDPSNMNSWMGFCLYVAGGVFIQDVKSDNSQPRSAANLEFILAAMNAIGNKHSITRHFTAQMELDIAAASGGPGASNFRAMNMGCMAPSIDSLRPLANRIYTSENSEQAMRDFSCLSVMPITGILPNRTRIISDRKSSGIIISNGPNWDYRASQSLYRTQNTGVDDPNLTVIGNNSPPASFTPPLNNDQGFFDLNTISNYEPITTSESLGNTPSDSSSSTNTVPFPYVQPDLNSHGGPTYGILGPPEVNYATDPESYSPMMESAFNPENLARPGANMQSLLKDQMWQN